MKELGVKKGKFVDGRFDRNYPNIVNIDVDLVDALENSPSGSTFSESVLFYIGVTLLHEAVHYGDFNYNEDYYNIEEEGYLFEEAAYGGMVNIDNEGNITITKK